MLNYSCLLSYSFFLLVGMAQNNLSPVYEIKSDTAISKSIDKAPEILEDYSGKLTVEQVRKPPFSLQFQPDTSQKLNFSVYAYWFRYRIKNTLDHAVSISFSCTSAYNDLYVRKSNDSISHFTTGALVPWSDRDGAKRICAITLTLQPHEEVLCYQRERFTFWFLFKPVQLWWGFASVQETQGINYTENGEITSSVIVYSTITGMLILALLFNIILFGISRDKLYLLYSAFLFCLVMYGYFSGDGPSGAKSTLVLREYPRLLDILYWTSANLYFFSLVHFLKTFVELPVRFPKWNKVLNIVSGVPLLLLIFPFISPYFSDTWNKVFIALEDILYYAIHMILLFIFIFYLWVKGYNKLNLIIVFPFLFVNAIIEPLINLYWLVLQGYGIKVTPLIVWLTNWSYLFSYGSLIILVLFISYRLLKRFGKYREQLAQERIQKETERALLIEHQKVELEKTVEERTSELKQSLQELKATQAQLIQSEKMASLGELTAGIAHEIQNPLNFVNNFSELNKELLEELKEEVDKGNYDEVKMIANDVTENEAKINHHGKRADAIVKGMLQHSRQTRGIKELTDINALCDEYIRLSYHGLRAKDKSFNADFKTDFDETIGKDQHRSAGYGKSVAQSF